MNPPPPSVHSLETAQNKAVSVHSATLTRIYGQRAFKGRISNPSKISFPTLSPALSLSPAPCAARVFCCHSQHKRIVCLKSCMLLSSTDLTTSPMAPWTPLCRAHLPHVLEMYSKLWKTLQSFLGNMILSNMCCRRALYYFWGAIMVFKTEVWARC